MKFSVGFALSLLLLSSNVASRSILQTTDLATVRELEHPSVVEGPKHAVDLEKRKGGGGGGRGGGGGGRSGGGRSGGSRGGGSGRGGRPRPRPGGGGAYPPRPA